MAMPAHLLDHGRNRRGGDARQQRKDEARRTVHDAALALFAERGFDATTVEEIASRAGISTATFFRYFASKRAAAFNDPEQWLPGLWQAILDRPRSEPDLEAVIRALQHEWAPRIDRPRAAVQVRAIESSPILRGLGTEVGLTWRAVVSDALARRHRLSVADPDCELTAAVALAVVGAATESWLREDADGDLSTALDVALDRMADLCRAWTRGPSSSGARPRARSV